MFIFVAAPVWPTQFELWKSGLVNLFEYIVPTAWYNRGLVIIADKYFTSLDDAKFLGDRKISLLGPIMGVVVNLALHAPLCPVYFPAHALQPRCGPALSNSALVT